MQLGPSAAAGTTLGLSRIHARMRLVLRVTLCPKQYKSIFDNVLSIYVYIYIRRPVGV